MITQDDVLYMIVTDRFADGDPQNNGVVDRSSLERSHGGDLQGILEHLPYLKELGVSVLWITPVYPNPLDAYHGYHPLDFEAVDPRLCSAELGPSGSRETLRRFVEIVHEHGLKVMLDVIIGHTAPGHPWLRERPSWFNENSPNPQKWWIWGLPDLNHDQLDVNEYFARNVLDWMGTGVDAIRIDAARHIGTPFWCIFKLFARGLRPDVTLVGEVWDASVSQVAPYQDLHDLDSMFGYPLYHAAVEVFTQDDTFARLARPELSPDEPDGIFDEDPAYRNAYKLVTFLGNHDTPRFFYLAGGTEKPDEALQRTRLALTFLFTTRGIPQLYYGDELAMDGGPHPDNRQDMAWSWLDPGRGPAVETSRAASLRDFTRELILLRRASTALRYGLLTTLYVTPTLYAYARTFPQDLRLVALNNSPKAVEVVIPVHPNPRLSSLARVCLPEGMRLVDTLGQAADTQIVNGCAAVRLGRRSGAVFTPAAPR
ncbi:MAG TPA: alpha-amylase family glycosyl hydrolase [Armatimonadota bacterium]|nr:alpha-amylase family glycosyl hydrolase [Armatimonadota bacterium]